MFKATAFYALFNYSIALNLLNGQEYDVCEDYEEVYEPLNIWRDDEIIENKVFYGMPTDDSKANDNVIRITGDNVTLRNVIIYHASNAMGIFCWMCHGLTLENVQIHAYGNEWGANACPSRSPFGGIDCSNIKLYHSDNVKMTNVLVENGSRGISCNTCKGIELRNIVAKNPRGPYAAGQGI